MIIQGPVCSCCLSGKGRRLEQVGEDAARHSEPKCDGLTKRAACSDYLALPRRKGYPVSHIPYSIAYADLPHSNFQ